MFPLKPDAGNTDVRLYYAACNTPAQRLELLHLKGERVGFPVPPGVDWLFAVLFFS